MTLSSRVRLAEAEGTAIRARDDGWMLDELKEDVGRIIPGDVLARLADENPRRARSELQSACKQAFASPRWAGRSNELKARLSRDLEDIVFGMGPLQSLVEDPTITEVMVNGTSSLFIERSGLLERETAVFTDEAQVRALIDRILAPLGRRVDESFPMVDARLPGGHRVNVVIPPIALDGPTITIRKFANTTMTLGDMQRAGSLDGRVSRLLAWAVRTRKNIAVLGGTGSGKTTLLNALSCEIPATERIVTIEDSAELRFTEHPHVVRMEARKTNAEGVGEVTIRDLVRNALRMRPDRIIVGECRGAETLEMLQAMNTGHDGSLSTIHANSPADALLRLENMLNMGANQMSSSLIRRQLASALDLLVQVERDGRGMRRITAVSEITADETGRDVIALPFFSFKHAADGAGGQYYRASPREPGFVEKLKVSGEYDQACEVLGL